MAVKDHPILFTGESIRAILNETKCQTRRVIKPQPAGNFYLSGDSIIQGEPGLANIRCPYGEIYDVLWVRENVATNGPWNIPEECSLWYPADGGKQPRGYQLRSSIHMPRWASRLTLQVTDVRVERVQDISREDALAEGVTGGCGPGYDFALYEFKRLWDSINAKRGFDWDSNPFVWVVEFAVIT